MKRIIIVVLATVVALVGFTFFTRSNASETGADAEEETDYQNIPLTARQVKTAGLSFGQVEDRNINSTLRANGQIVLRAKDKGDVASLMGGIVKNIYVNDGQYVKKGQTVALMRQSQYHAATNTMLAARRQLDYYNRSGNEATQKMADISRLAYQNGEISYIEHVSALQQSIDTGLKYAAAINSYNQSVIRLMTLRGDFPAL